MSGLFASPYPLLVAVPKSVRVAGIKAAKQAAMIAEIREIVKRGGLRRGGVVNLHGVR